MTGKVVVLTGGAYGIGWAAALAFAREGAAVVIGDIVGAENTVATIRDMGSKADWLRVDVAKSDDVQTLIRNAVDQYGGLDFAFNEVESIAILLVETCS